MEASSYDVKQAATYTIKATAIPEGIDPLVVNLSAPGITAVFDHNVANQSASREFIVDTDKVSALSSGQVTGALSLVGSATVSFSSPTHVTVTSVGNDSSGWFKIEGTDANNASAVEYLAGADGTSSTKTAVSLGLFKTVTAITFKDAKTGTINNKQTAGKVKAGTTDENKSYTVTVTAPQDSKIENNPHIETITHAIKQNGTVLESYKSDLSNIAITVQDVKLPIASDATVQMSKGASYTFKTSDFGYTDPDGLAMTKIQITKLEKAGNLTLNGDSNHVTLNQEIAVADISKLKFAPADANAGGSGYGNFEYKVHDGLDYSASAAEMKVNVGDSVETTIKYFAQNTTGTPANQLIKNATLIIKDNGGNSVHAGSYSTNNSGIVDLLGVSDGTYTASYKLTDGQTDSIINALDVSGILDISSGLNGSPTNKQKLTSDLNGDGNINALDVSAVLDLSSGLNNSGATAVLRDASASNPFSTKSFSVSSGSDITLSAYVLGDLNGTYADIL